MKKKMAALALTLILLTRGGLLMVSAAAFSDVDEGLYYAAPIAWAVEKGITTGTSETTFSPTPSARAGRSSPYFGAPPGLPGTREHGESLC